MGVIGFRRSRIKVVFPALFLLSLGVFVLTRTRGQNASAPLKWLTALASKTRNRKYGTVSWSECAEGCCEKAIRVVKQAAYTETNLVCFHLNFGENLVQQYFHLTPFDHVFSHYLSMARKFFETLSTHDNLSGEIVWKIQDDATIDVVSQTQFMLARVATVGHSIHRIRGNISMYTALVPNFHFIEHNGFSYLSKYAATISAPFKSLRPQVFWAGSTTGHPRVPCRDRHACNNSCKKLQRYELVRLSQEIEWLNFSLTNAIQLCKGYEAELEALSMLSNRANEDEWMNYRGILDVDGNVDAWGSRWRFATNSVVFKVKSEYINHYSSVLIDGEHFIEISESLADLQSKTALVIRSDKKTLSYMANIAKNARQTIAAFTLESASESAAFALVNFFDSRYK